MAARPGEDMAATLFADIHYFYGPPTAKPPHHRFDKGSYVCLFENPSLRRARIEVANNAGTPDQDAFNGYLDGVHILYSYKHSTLVTLTVDAPNSPRNSPRPSDQNEWHLPTLDPRNENKYMYKLHTIDIYFWNKEDAIHFVDGVRRILPPHQTTVKDEPVPPAPHLEEMSAVVQKLENVVVIDPGYQHGRTRDSRNTTTASSFSGPPISATPQNQEAANFAPMAYNPAAPAAPESIKYREKTPPPKDGAANPLVAAAASDNGQPYAPGYPQQQYIMMSGPSTQGQAPPTPIYFPGPPQQLQSQYGHTPPQPPQPPQPPYGAHPHLQRAATMPVPPPTSSVSPFSPPPTGPPSYQAGPPQSQGHVPVNQHANYPSTPGFASPMSSPGVYTPGAPPGGFATFNYVPTQVQPGQQVSGTQPLMTDYSIHQQVYRPTEGEATAKVKPAKAPRGKLEERAGQLERGVGGFLKKLEKRIG
ncbi:hypothetical protein B7494_g558 [Chlorociboria aeruginascens]|nr:hypothetical protein B7494_g558 [Chlorociboria aeruginascens]